MSPKNFHAVQVGCDDSILSAGSSSDTRNRQLAYARELKKQCPGALMTYVVLTTKNIQSELQFENLRVIPVPRSRIRTLGRLLRALANLHHRQPIHVLSSQDITGIGLTTLAFAKSMGIPVLGQIHYEFFAPFVVEDCFGGGLIGRIKRQFFVSTLPYYSALRVVGRNELEEIRRRYPDAQIEIIPVPVTLPEPALDRAQLLARAPLVLFTGRLVKQKNLSLWLDTAFEIKKNFPAAKFRIVGEGGERRILEARLQALNPSMAIEFTGGVPNESLAAHYEEAAVFLLTSHYEGFSRVVVEAKLHGAVPVTTDIAGPRDLIANGVTGYVCQEEQLASRVIELLRDPKKRSEMAQAGAARMGEKYTVESLAPLWIRQLLAHGKRERCQMTSAADTLRLSKA